MKRTLFLLLSFLLIISCDFSNYILEQDYDFETVFEKTEGKETATYSQVIDFYQDLAAVFPEVNLREMGTTDSGEPLHLVLFSKNKQFDLEALRSDQTVLFILNGIHPGESDGIDATMMLFRDLAKDSIPLPENTVIATIPVYNIGGALNRNSFSRANQNGPKSYGFRGNARNYDLNRDFIKADTRNTRSFYEIFHLLNPDVLVDTHVSNGADYQYSLTHLFTQHNKLGGAAGEFLKNELMPALEDSLREKNLDITPYVNVFNKPPEEGFSQFLDTPRYSTGYAALWNTFGMMIETHMLKPYPERVRGTYEILRSMIDLTESNASTIEQLRSQAFRDFPRQQNYSFDFKVDSTKHSVLNFKGYQARRVPSDVTGSDRLLFDRTQPFTKEVPYYDYFEASRKVSLPEGYIIPQGWWPVLELLRLNDVEFQQFKKDTALRATVYRIDSFQTSRRAYEGHYPHSDTRVRSGVEKVQLRAGDFFVPIKQRAAKYLMATLEPEAPDSFFNWNFFDSVLQQKEHFSPYVFEELAREFLDDHPQIEEQFLSKKEKEPEFGSDPYAQLEWIYKRSEFYEKSHLRYPIFRIGR